MAPPWHREKRTALHGTTMAQGKAGVLHGTTMAHLKAKGFACQPHHGAAAVQRDGGVGRQAADDLRLELVLGEHAQRLLAADHRALELLLLLHDLRRRRAPKQAPLAKPLKR
jgi:hypothetical protein